MPSAPRGIEELLQTCAIKRSSLERDALAQCGELNDSAALEDAGAAKEVEAAVVEDGLAGESESIDDLQSNFGMESIANSETDKNINLRRSPNRSVAV